MTYYLLVDTKLILQPRNYKACVVNMSHQDVNIQVKLYLCCLQLVKPKNKPRIIGRVYTVEYEVKILLLPSVQQQLFMF
jgi:hypothetical protein